jgi:lipopolysaccharide/colanic/teichoic acid biosynthesis glycosyltransferase
MSDCQLPLGSEADYVVGAYATETAVPEIRHLQVSILPSGLRTKSWQYQFAKRLLDFTVAVVMLSISLIPGLIIAALVAATTDGPIFYREWRIGKGGRPFRIWKFRSMSVCVDPPEGVHSGHGVLLQWRVKKDGCDPRITRVGKFLRQWSLDELPQLFNVLRGEMSLVGPRPVVKAEIPLYGTMRHYYYAAAPGLSGLWQVSGRSNINFQARVSLDVFYVQHWSLLTDCKILWKTIPAVLGRTGAR